MAEVLKEYDWSDTSKHTGTPRSRFYPWAEWLDGRIWRLVRGEDFDGPAISIERVIRTSANRRDIKVRVRVEDETTVVLQAHLNDEAVRGVTKSPSQKAVKAAKAEQAEGRGNGVASGAVVKATKRAATPAPTKTVKRATNTEVTAKPKAVKRATKPVTPAKAAANGKRKSRRLVKTGD